jgi:hypothetical protein
VAAAILGWTCGLAGRSEALPSFAQQTGQPCAACHVGAFGPQLKPYGRDFKLYGYTSSDGQAHFPPIAVAAQASFTHTSAPQEALLTQGFKANDNFIAGEEVSLYYAGRIAKEVGAFVQVTYDGGTRDLHWDNMDLRYAHPTQIFGKDAVLGLTVTNSPTVQDLWNSTPSWGFPYSGSSIAPAPAAATLLDQTLAGQVLGAGAYAAWNDWLYLEASAYRNLSPRTLDRFGSGPGQGGDADTFPDLIPYGRLAIEHAGDKHYVQAGAMVLAAERYPGGDRSAGTADQFVDRAFDANYQFTGSATHFVSAHAIYIDESEDLRADRVLNGTLANDRLHTLRADVSYSFRDTWTPSIQVFKTTGSNDPALWGTSNGSPDSRGYVAELAYVPWGKAKSPLPWLNLRLAVQYVSYAEFDGTTRGSSMNDTLYVNFWVAGAPFYSLEKSPILKPAAH